MFVLRYFQAVVAQAAAAWIKAMLLGQVVVDTNTEEVVRLVLDGVTITSLEPALTTCYTRSTLLVGAGSARVTIDTDVEAHTPDGRTVTLVGMAIAETKSGGPPSEADRVLWSLGYRPTRVSKFCTSLAALRPELPSNAWTRALRRPWLVSSRRVQEAVLRADRPFALAG